MTRVTVINAHDYIKSYGLSLLKLLFLFSFVGRIPTFSLPKESTALLSQRKIQFLATILRNPGLLNLANPDLSGANDLKRNDQAKTIEDNMAENIGGNIEENVNTWDEKSRFPKFLARFG